MKNRKKIIMWVLVAVAIWAVWYFFLKKKGKPSTGTETEEKNNVGTNTGIVIPPIFGPPTMPTNQALSYSGKRLIVPGYNVN